MATYLPDRITPPLQDDAQPGNGGYIGDYLPAMIDQIGPINVNGTLFIPMGDQAFFGTVTFYISTDNGLTWTPDSSGVTQGCRNWAADWNPTTGLFTIAYLESVSPGSFIPIQVRQYNPTTQTWGANLTAGSLCASILTVRTRPNGDVLVGNVTGEIFVPPSFEHYVVSVLSGGTWADYTVPPYDPGSRLSASPTMTAAMSSNGVLYILTNWLSGVTGGPGSYFYHRFNSANAFDVNATFFEIPPNTSNLIAGNMMLDESNDYWAVGWFDTTQPVGSKLNVAKLAGLGSPYLSQSTAMVPDSGLHFGSVFANGGNQFSQPLMTLAGGFVYIGTIVDVLGQPSLAYTFRSPASQPFGPYTQLLTMDVADTSPAVSLINNPLIAELPNGNPGLFFNALSASSRYGRYTLGLPAPPPSLSPIKITFRGVKRVRCNSDVDVRDVPAALPSPGRAM